LPELPRQVQEDEQRCQLEKGRERWVALVDQASSVSENPTGSE
jgi:hypothetical protein